MVHWFHIYIFFSNPEHVMLTDMMHSWRVHSVEARHGHAFGWFADCWLGYYEDGYIVQVPNPGVPLSSLFFSLLPCSNTPDFINPLFNGLSCVEVGVLEQGEH